MVAAQRHQRADPGHRARHRRRQHPVPSDRRRQRRRRRLLQADPAARRDHPLRPAPDLPGHRRRRIARRAAGRPDARQHLRPGVPARHPAVRPGPHHHPADRRRQFDLRRRRGDGHRAGGARPCRTGRGGGLHRGGVRHPGHLPLSGAVPARPGLGAAAARPWHLGRVHRCHGARGGPGGRRGSLDRHRGSGYRSDRQDGPGNDVGALPDPALGLAGTRQGARRQHSGATKITIPWFAVGFVLVAGLNSLVSLPPALVSHVNDLDTFLLAMAMAASASARTSRRSAAPASSRCCWPPCYSPGWCSAVDYSPAWRSPESSARKPCTARRKASCRASTSSMPWPRRQPWTSPLPG